MSDFITDDVLDVALAAGRAEYRRNFQMTHDPGVARLVDAAVKSALEAVAPLIATQALEDAVERYAFTVALQLGYRVRAVAVEDMLVHAAKLRRPDK